MAKTLDQVLEKLRKRAEAAGAAHQATYEALDEHFSEVAKELQVARDLEALRKRKKMSQRELSRKSQIDQAEVSRILSGRTSPRVPTVQRLARALGAELRVVPLTSARVASSRQPRSAASRPRRKSSR